MEILDDALIAGRKELPGHVAFKLHDTYGFPLDLTQDVCRERGVTVDVAGFDEAVAWRKAAGRAAGKFRMDKQVEYGGAANVFTGYDELVHASKVVALYHRGTPTDALKAGQSGIVVLDTTPFYTWRRPGGRRRRAGCRRRGVRRGRHAEDQGRRVRPPRRDAAGHAEGGRHRTGPRGHRAPRRHHAQPQRHAPDAQGAARGTRRPRAAEGQPGGCREDALRLRAQRTGHARADHRDRAPREREDPAERRHPGAADGHRERARTRP